MSEVVVKGGKFDGDIGNWRGDGGGIFVGLGGLVSWEFCFCFCRWYIFRFGMNFVFSV